MTDTEYKEIFNKYKDYNLKIHEDNQKKIRIGLKVNIFVPLIFLILSFSMKEAKLIFLLLWVISLFGIAFYLIYVEFNDYKMMKQMKEFGFDGVPKPEQMEQIEQLENLQDKIEEKLRHKQSIVRIFLADAKKIWTNAVAVVVIIGLSVIPSLYAWFNILSNWDPYGEEATSHLNVVVASMDEGTEIEGMEINVGDIVVSNLKENDTIGWVFVDSKQEAVDGVYSGDYYAALVIDEEFTENLISFLGGDLTHPKISYYENDKKNAIAPKITGKVKTTVQEEINTAFVSTLAETILKMSDYVATSKPNGSVTEGVLDKLYSLDRDMETYITIMDSYISIIDASSSLMDATKEVSDQLDKIMETGRTIANSAQITTGSAGDAIEDTSDLVALSIDDIRRAMISMEKSVDDILDDAQNAGSLGEKQIKALQLAIDALQSRFDTSMDSVHIDDATKREEVKQKRVVVDEDFDQLDEDLKKLGDASAYTSDDVKKIAERMQEDFHTCEKSLDDLYNTYNNVIDPQISHTMNAISNSIYEIEDILNYSSDSIHDVASSLDSYPDMVSFGKEHLVKTRDEAVDMESKLKDLIDDVEHIDENDQYNLLMSLIESDPELIADFISSPVNLDQEPVYAIANNGSATTPFYVILSIWFGSLILIAIIHTRMKEEKDIPMPKNYQQFFGRYIVFFLTGQLQTIITVLGCILYVRIQVQHPFLFWLAAAITSMTFSLFMYALGYALGNVGEAAAVVLMVIQVAGSGGTFPIEVLPKVFQILYKYMPFAYGMNAIRETIGGMHGNDYWKYLGGMLIYIAVALILGLIISKPAEKLNELIEESKEKTDLLL